MYNNGVQVQDCTDMFSRTIQKQLTQLAEKYPVVTVLGPRQSGKTTLVKSTFSSKPYANLDAPDTRELASSDPRGFLKQFPDGAIFDEIQRVPELLSYIQVIVDEADLKGMFILTGSHQLNLHQAVSQSLAGRTALLTLYPMTINELAEAGFNLTLDEQILHGFYPRIYKDQLNPNQAYRDYFRTYVERDVRLLINVKDMHLFEKFIRLCAGRIGSVLELSSLSNDVGVSSKTIQHWLSILEASYIIFRLQPYYNNFGKRMIKSPKLYFTDVGLATYLLDIEHANQVARDPLRGFLFENLVILELMKYRLNRNLSPNIYFYRDNHKNEVDVLIKYAREVIAVEIKSAQTFNNEFLKGLKFLRKSYDQNNMHGYVIYAGEQEQKINEFQLLNYCNTSEIWEDIE